MPKMSKGVFHTARAGGTCPGPYWRQTIPVSGKLTTNSYENGAYKMILIFSGKIYQLNENAF